jgi:uncharacterized coiled-coil DUF342 family protein
MSLQKLQDRLADLAEKQKRLREKINTCTVRSAALKGARVDALSEGTGTDAIDNELKGIKADADDCREAISAIGEAIIKVKAQIVDEQNRLRAEHDAELDKQLAAPIVSLLRDCPKIETALTKLVDAAHERFYAPGFIHNIDRKIPGFDQLPRFIEREFRLQMSEKLNAIMAGALLAPVDGFRDDAPDEPELSRKEILQHELAEAKRRLPVLVENRQHITEYAPYGDGLVKFEKEAEKRGEAVDSCYAEIRRLETELANLDAEEN